MADDLVIPGIDEDEQDVITYNYGSVEEVVQRGRTYSTTSYSQYYRSYAQVSPGVIRLGDRNLTTGALTTRCYLSADMAISDMVCGISTTAKKIHIDAPAGLYVRVGNKSCVNGYLQVITSVKKSQSTGVTWVIEKLPFRGGICVAKR